VGAASSALHASSKGPAMCCHRLGATACRCAPSCCAMPTSTISAPCRKQGLSGQPVQRFERMLVIAGWCEAMLLVSPGLRQQDLNE